MNSHRVKLTDQESALLDFIRTYIREHGYPPSVREAMGGVGVKSTSTVSLLLGGLVGKGWITRGPGPRMITIVDGAHDTEGT